MFCGVRMWGEGERARTLYGHRTENDSGAVGMMRESRKKMTTQSQHHQVSHPQEVLAVLLSRRRWLTESDDCIFRGVESFTVFIRDRAERTKSSITTSVKMSLGMRISLEMLSASPDYEKTNFVTRHNKKSYGKIFHLMCQRGIPLILFIKNRFLHHTIPSFSFSLCSMCFLFFL